MMWLNWSVATINATLQLLDIYRLAAGWAFHTIVCYMVLTKFSLVSEIVVGGNCEC